MFFKEGGVLLLLKKTHTFFFFFSRARDFLLHSFLQTAVPTDSTKQASARRVILRHAFPAARTKVSDIVKNQSSLLQQE